MKIFEIKNVKIVLCVCAIVLFLIFCFKSKFNEKNEFTDFGVNVTTENGEYSYTIKWYKQDAEGSERYFMTLPCSVKEKKVTANFSGNTKINLDGKKLKSGDVIEGLSEGYHLLIVGEEEYIFYVNFTSDIPTLYIATESGTQKHIKESRENKEGGYISIVDHDKLIYKDTLEYIKCRGNYTWTLNKKPYNIKFHDEIDLFGMGAAKKWCLIANYLDGTMLKDKIGYDFADEVGLKFSPQTILVDVYINDEYMGNYTLSEAVEVSENRVDIVDLDELNKKANVGANLAEFDLGGVRGEESHLERGSAKWVDIPNNPVDFSGGYLIEFELDSRYDDELCGFISKYGQPVILKSPEYATCAQVEYIRDYYQAFEDALLDEKGYNKAGKHYSDYIDVESFAKMYLFQEFIKNLDGVGTSLFFYKNPDGKLTAGPVWDVDLGFGGSYEREGIKMDDPNTLWINGSHLANDLSDKYSIFSLLCKHAEFQKEAKRQWELYFEPNIEKLLYEIESLYAKNKDSIISDKCKWNIDDDYILAQKQVEKSIVKMKNFIEQRSAFLTEYFIEK